MIEYMFIKGASNAFKAFNIKLAGMPTEKKLQAMQAAAARRGLKYTGTGENVSAADLHFLRTGRRLGTDPKKITPTYTPEQMARMPKAEVQLAPGIGATGKRFVSGQGAAAKNLAQGIKNLGSAPGRNMVMRSFGQLLPSVGIGAAGLYLGHKALSGNDDENRVPQMPRAGYGY